MWVKEDVFVGATLATLRSRLHYEARAAGAILSSDRASGAALLHLRPSDGILG